MSRISLLGSGFIGDFYTQALHGKRGRDRVQVAYSRTIERANEFCGKWDIPTATTDLEAAIRDDATDTLQFSHDSLADGDYWVRLRVDGVDSVLVDRSTTPPTFVADQTVTVPTPEE